MHYIDEGAGKPAVFVHGNPAWSFEFRNIIKELSGEFRCIAPDHIGFGLSDKPADWNYLPESHAENLNNLLESLGLSEITMVVGDWGGPIGLSYTLNHPEKTKSLIITNTWMWSVKRDWYYRLFSKFTGGSIGRFLIYSSNFFVRIIMPMIFGRKENLTPKVKNHYIMPLAKPSERKGCAVFPESIIGSSEWLSSLWEKKDILKNKNITIIWGGKDIAFRKKELSLWKKSFPKADVTVLEDCGHFIAEEAPAMVVKIIKILT